MSYPDPNVPTACGMAPPTVPRQFTLEPQRPTWPTVIGVILIVLSAITVLGSAWAIATVLIPETVSGYLPPDQLSVQVELAERWRPWSIPISGFGAALAILAIVGGSQLAGRRTSSVRTLHTWSILKIVGGVGGSVFAVCYQRDVSELMRGQSGMPTLPESVESAMLITGFLFGVAWSAALPVFLLIWFNRTSVRAEVARWGPPV